MQDCGSGRVRSGDEQIIHEVFLAGKDVMMMPPTGRVIRMLLLAVLLLPASACSIKKYTMGKMADALAGGATGSTFASDDDPELIEAALPFSLKLIEALLEELPDHYGLLLAATSGFTQYSYAFVQLPADRVEMESFSAAEILRDRSRKLYLRAREYGLCGLETRHKNFAERLRDNSVAAVKILDRKDVPFLYWTAASWGAAISISKDDPDMIGDQLIVEALIDRAFELDPDYNDGAIYGFLISYEGARQGAEGDPVERSRRHFDKAVALTQGQSASPYVSLAEALLVEQENRGEFKALLEKALEVDVNRNPELRLMNIIMHRRARWLLSRIDEFFLPVDMENEERK
jgi:predicted anti-sigma-YlaC factor YlaD